MRASTSLVEFREKFRLDELTILETRHWNWAVRVNPCTLGAGILSTNRWCPSLAELSDAEAQDLVATVRIVERRLESTFSPDGINYLALMMSDPTVHFHVVPRYGTQQTFAGLEWVDERWPRVPSLTAYQDRYMHPSLLHIREALRIAN